jgi:dipeptide transport system permease protein
MKFILKKLIQFSTLFLGITLLSFSLIRMVPGDPALLMLGERGGSPEEYARINENLGLNKSLPTQYFIFIKNIASGDLGTSIVSKQPVWKEFKARFPATFELGLFSLFFAILFGIPLGILAALNRNKPLDYGIMGVSLMGYSMPIFWWGLVLILIFSVSLGLTPVSGRISIMYDIEPITGFLLIDSFLSNEGFPAFIDALKHLILPAIVLGTIPLAVIVRMTRSSMLEVLGESYIETATAKGLSRKKIVFVHALRNALIPVVTVIGLMFGSIITGAILTETIFSWPGIGKWMVASVTSRDYPVIQSGILLIATFIVIINSGVDFLYHWINPRMR